MSRVTSCRSCGAPALRTFLDLGKMPLADALVRPDDLTGPEDRFELAAALCEGCALVQITEEVDPTKLFVDNYLYFSSFSDHLLAHSRAHAVGLVESRRLGPDSLVVELASNDGYLLANFVDAGIPVLGIDPAPDQAAAARARGVPTIERFFGAELAAELRDQGHVADVIIANNVMAHVPDLGGFVSGMATLLADDGVITVENPSVWDLVERVAFDTIYHEHHCYYSCLSVDALVRRHGLYLNDVDIFPELHGGTNRWTIAKRADPSDRLLARLEAERAAGLDRFEFYAGFGQRVEALCAELRATLQGLVADGQRVAAYGAAAKGATLLNAAGIGTDLVSYVVDRNPYKQGLHMPGTHQPIHDPEVLATDRPDVLLLLAWNFADEIMAQQADHAAAGGRFLVPVPEPRLVP